MRLWRGTAILAGSNALGTAFGIAFSIVVSRVLGPAGKGVLAILITILQVANVAGNLGFYRSNMYYAGQQPEARGRIAANAIAIAMVLGSATALVFFYAVTACGHAVLGDAPPWLLARILLGVPFYFYTQYAQGQLLGMGQIVPCQAVDVGGRGTLLVGAVVITVPLHLGLEAIVAWYVGVLVVQAAAYAIIVRLKSGPSPVWFDTTLFRSQVRYAARTYGAALLAFVLSRIDLFFVHWYFGDAPAGLYSITNQVVDVLSYVPLAMAAQLIPHLAQSTDDDGRATCAAARRLLLLMLGLGLAVALAAWPGMRVLYGPPFLGAVPSMWAVLPGALFLALQTLLAGDLAGRGYPSFLVWVWLPGFVVDAIGMPWLVPAWGLVGAAAVTSAAYAVVCLLTVRYFLRFHRLDFRDLAGYRLIKAV